MSGRYVDRRARWFAVAYVPVIALYVYLAVLLASSGVALVWIMGVGVHTVIAVFVWLVPPSTEVTAQGVRVRQGLYSRRLPWREIIDIDLPGRFTDGPRGRRLVRRRGRGRWCARALTSSGRRVRLFALPLDVAEGLAVAVHHG